MAQQPTGYGGNHDSVAMGNIIGGNTSGQDGFHMIMQNSFLNGMASYEQSCIFFGNIPYDAQESEL